MKKRLCVSILVVLLGGFFVSSLLADDTLVKFKGGIAVIPVSNVTVAGSPPVVTVTRNIVRGVNPPGQIWRIDDLKADIKVLAPTPINRFVPGFSAARPCTSRLWYRLRRTATSRSMTFSHLCHPPSRRCRPTRAIALPC